MIFKNTTAWLVILTWFLSYTATPLTAQTSRFTTDVLPPFPNQSGQVKASAVNGVAIVFSDTNIYTLAPNAEQWTEVKDISLESAPLAVARSGNNTYGILPSEVSSKETRVFQLNRNTDNGQFERINLAPLPVALPTASAVHINGVLHVTDGQSVWLLNTSNPEASWEPFETALPMAVQSPSITTVLNELYLFGVDSAGAGLGYRYIVASKEWRLIENVPDSRHVLGVAPYGLSYIFFFTSEHAGDDGAKPHVLAYHTIADRFVDFGELGKTIQGSVSATEVGGDTFLAHPGGAFLFRPTQVQTNYGWLDNGVIAIYLIGMVGVGWIFARKENSTNDYFRGGQRIPWWAAGMSLFATGASAISLAGMPGMGFGTDWTYFSLSLFYVLCLPIALFVMAPLVRRLNMSTANEYLERRFGLTSRLFASTIWIITQTASRIASVMLLSAIALEAITDMNIITSIVIIGLVTTSYTYLGGLSAVIWTDTIQGFVMVLTVLGCLLLALFSLNSPPADLWNDVLAYEKLRMFDWDVSTWARTTTLVLFLHVFIVSFIGVTDQNFVQRVHSTPNLKQTKLAVGMQMAVAVPINLLLFTLGTVLWLFYREQPADLSPTMVNNDAVFPFFAAQQLPTGVSGIVVAALLAATMSTVSSGICSVSDLCTNDFYKRFKKNPTDRQVLVLGRLLTATVGVLGTLAAILLAQLDGVKSVWDLAIMVTGLISSSIIGLFMLGLVSTRTHQLGVLVGAIAGILSVVYLKMYTDTIFWIYMVAGNVCTMVVGIAASFILPGKPRSTEGLTFFSLLTKETPTETS